MKKLISMISALVMAVTMFTTTSLAAPAETSSNPAINGSVIQLMSNGYLQMKFSLINNETLSYYEHEDDFGDIDYIQSNGINAMQVIITLDSNVFDVSNSKIVANKGISDVNTVGGTTDTLKFTYSPTTIAGYMTTVPEYLFYAYAPLKEGYTADNIPDSAIKYGESIIEYKSYDKILPSADPSTYTIYAANPAGKYDYSLTTTFTGTAKETTKYTVTYKVDGVQYGDPVEVEEGKTVAALPTAPTKEGHTFTGWVIEGTETAFTAETTINANTTVVAVFTKNEEEKYGTPITEGAYKGKTLYFNEAGATTFNFGTDKGIEITKTVGETSEKKVFGVKYLYDKGIEVENGGDATATFTIGIIDVNDLAKGTFSFRVLKSLE